MKKSWHPLLQKNQERVWQEENKAREERKRIEQKRKEIAEERQLQELQRLQESQGGKARQERLDWMYAAPGSGGQNTSESLEAYLLGKKKVDDLITGDDNDKLKRGADATGFMAMQNANSATDTRNKVFNDPLLAIKKQEQRKFEELMNNPIMLKKLKKEMEKKKDGKDRDKEDGEKRKHHHHRHHHRHRSSERRKEDRSEKRHRHQSPDRHSSKRRDTDDGYSRSRRHEYDDRGSYRRERSSRRSLSPRRTVESSASEEESKKAALQAMLANAEDLESARAERLAALEVKEKADEERERQDRERARGLGGRAGFVRDMQNRIIDEGLMMKVR